MLIDWFTVSAQIVNFLILVALLKHFLYGPILRTMDERERMIASRLEEAEETKQEAEREMVFYQHKVAAWEEEQQTLLAQAKRDAEVLRKELIHKARAEVEENRTLWHELLQREQVAFQHELRRQISTQLYTVARQALRELANASLEQQVIDSFIERLHVLDAKQREVLVSSLRRADKTVQVRSTFVIPEKLRGELIQLVRDVLIEDVYVRFEQAPELICGVELRIPGYQLSWSLRQYLEALEAEVVKALEEELQAEPQAAQAPPDELARKTG